MRNVARVIAAGTTSLLLVGLAPLSPAQALSSHITGTAPGNGTSMTAMPGQIKVTFDSAVAPPGGTLTVTRANGGTATPVACPMDAYTAGDAFIACSPTVSGTAAPEDTYAVRVQATLVGPPPVAVDDSTYTFSIDRTAPTLSSTTPAAGGSVRPKTANATTGYTAVASEALKNTSSIVIKNSTSAVVPSTPSFPSASSVKATPNALLTPGAYTAEVTLVDAAGNSTSAITRSFTVAAMPAPLVAITPNPYNKNSGSVPVVVTGSSAESGDSIAITLATTGSPTVQSKTVTSTTNGAYDWSFTSSTADGTLTATATATDVDGNTSTTATATGLKDVVTPQLVSTAPANGGSQKSTTNNQPNGITAVASETLSQTASTITVTKDGNAVATNRSFPTAASITATPVAVLTEGTYTATITLVDLAGNASSPLSSTFTIDDTPPAAPSFDPAPALINLVRQNAYTVTGNSNVPGAVVTVTFKDSTNAVLTGTAVVASNGGWTVTKDVHTLADGVVRLAASQTDAAGNTSLTPASGSTQKDTVAPRAGQVAFGKSVYGTPSPIAADVAGFVDNGTNTSGEGGDKVEVTIKDTASHAISAITYTSTAVGHVGEFTAHFADLSSLADGTLTAEVVASDGVDNPSAKVTNTALKDTGAPATPTVTMTNPINIGNAPHITVSGTSEPGASVTVSVNDNDSTTAPVPAAGTVLANGSYAVGSIDVSSLADGVLTATVTARDAAGNLSASGTGTATKDTQAPLAPEVTVPAYVSAANVAAVPVSGTAEPLSVVALHVTDTGSGVVDKTATAAANGAWSTTLNLTSLADGQLSLQAIATDVAGNPGAATVKTPVKDTVVPGMPATSLSPTVLDYAHRAADLVISGSGTGATQADIAIVNGQGTTVLTRIAPVTSNAFSYTLVNADVLTLPEGTLSVRVILEDAAGNKGLASVSSLVKDVTKLAVATTTPAAPYAVQSASQVVVTFNEAVVTGSDAAAPPYTAITLKKAGVTLAGSHLFSGDAKTVTFTPGSPLSEGVYDVFVHATDINDTNDVINDDAGATPTFSFTVDATAPVAPTVTAVTDPVTAANKTAVVVSGNATEAGLTVVVTITGTSGAPISKSGVSGLDGAYTVSGIDVSGLADGVLTSTAVSTDDAGNTGPVSSAKTATKDATLPVVSGLAATATKYGHLTSTVTGAVSEASAVTLTATQGATQVSGPATVAADKTFSGTLDFSGFTSGAVTVTAVATDVVGNHGEASVATTHDAAIPPGAPAKPVATAGDRKASVAFSAPATTGSAPITSYTVVATSGSLTRSATGTASPILVTGLTNGVDWTFTVKATNRAGTGAASPASDPVTPLGVSTISLNALPSRVIYGTYITLAGVVHRTDSSKPFDTVGVFARTDAGSLRLLTEVPVSSTGAWSYRLRPSINYRYFAAYVDEVNDLSVSVVRRVLVAVKVTASAPTGSHTVNQVITGSVSPKKAGKPVYLYRVTSTGSLVKIASATISSTSTYRFSVRLPAGSTKLRVIVPTTTNNVAGSVTFTAKRT